MIYEATFVMFGGCMLDVARTAGKVGGLTVGVFTDLCGALPLPKRKGCLQVFNIVANTTITFFIAIVLITVSGCSSVKKAYKQGAIENFMTMTTMDGKFYFWLEGAGTVTIDWGDGSKKITTELIEGEGVGFNYEYSKTSRRWFWWIRTVTITGNITILDCSDNDLIKLNVSHNSALQELDCSDNQLKKLDVSRNIALQTLNCSENRLKKLDVSLNTALQTLNCNQNRLTELDISHNAALLELNCGDNRLTMLDVSRNTALEELDCSDNQLTALDVGANTALMYLYCWNNQLKTLDVSKNTSLIFMICSDNQLTKLDISQNKALTGLRCNYNHLTALNVSHNTALTRLDITDNQLSENAINDLLNTLHDNEFEKRIDLSNNPGSSAFNANTGRAKGWVVVGFARLSQPPPRSTRVGAGAREGIITMSTIASQVDFELYGMGKISIDWGDGLDIETKELTTLIKSMNFTRSFPDSSERTITIFGRNIVCLVCDNNQLTALDVTLNTSLSELFCRNNLLTELDVSRNNALIELYCCNNLLTELDVSKAPALKALGLCNNRLSSDNECAYCTNENVPTMTMTTEARVVTLSLSGVGIATIDWGDGRIDKSRISNQWQTFKHEYDNENPHTIGLTGSVITGMICSNNKLTALDVKRNTSLTYLQCNRNRLTSLDVSHNKALVNLICYSNRLTSLDVNCNPALAGLQCYSNPLTTLDVSRNPALTLLLCDYNRLTELDLSNNTALKELHCRGIKLTELDLSKNTALTVLFCGNNQLTELDLSQNTMLAVLECDNNLLTALNLSKNTALQRLICTNNQLTELDLSHNTALTRLECNRNQLTLLDVSQNRWMKHFDCSRNQLTALDISQNTALEKLNFRNNLLTTLDASLNTALTSLDCVDNQLTADALNALFATLHNISFKYKTIFISNNPGSSYCEPTIAEANGWRINDFTPPPPPPVEIEKTLTASNLYTVIYETNNIVENYLKIELIDEQFFNSKKNTEVSFLLRDTTVIRKIEGTIKLPCRDTVRIFTDVPPIGETRADYRYIGQIEFLNKYVIYGSFFESWAYFLIDKNTCDLINRYDLIDETTSDLIDETNGQISFQIDGFPNISPDKKFMISISPNYYADCYSELALYSISDNNFKMIGTAFFKNWMPLMEDHEMFWSADGYLYLTVNHVNSFWNYDGNLNEKRQHIRMRALDIKTK